MTRKAPIRTVAAFVLLASLVHATSARAASSDEENNITVYRDRGKGVVHITSQAVGLDYFYNPIPTGGVGSGAILDKKGRIVTNNHVIQNAQSLEVTLSDGTKWDAKLVGTDPLNDIAVIAEKKVGDKVVVGVSRPGGLKKITVTLGEKPR